MFDEVLASVGIGSANVDTLIDHEPVSPGEKLSAQVVIEGGETDQEIEGLERRFRKRHREKVCPAIGSAPIYSTAAPRPGLSRRPAPSCEKPSL